MMRSLVTDVLERWWAPAAGVAAGLVAWVILASVFPRNIMPFPTETLLITWELVVSGRATHHLSATLYRMFWGFIGVMILSIALGVILGFGRYWEDFATPYLMIFLAMPALAIAAGATLIFGFGDLAPIATAIITIFPYITMTVWKGVEDIDMDLVMMGSAFDASNRRLLRAVIFPSIAPALFTASRMGLSHSWRIVTLSEMFASGEGLGQAIISAYDFYRFSEVWGWAVIFLVIVLLIEFVIFKPVHRIMFAYRGDEKAIELQ